MIGVQELAILLVRDDDVAAGVHGVRVGHVRAVGAVIALGQLAFWAREVDIPARAARAC